MQHERLAQVAESAARGAGRCDCRRYGDLDGHRRRHRGARRMPARDSNTADANMAAWRIGLVMHSRSCWSQRVTAASRRRTATSAAAPPRNSSSTASPTGSDNGQASSQTTRKLTQPPVPDEDHNADAETPKVVPCHWRNGGPITLASDTNGSGVGSAVKFDRQSRQIQQEGGIP